MPGIAPGGAAGAAAGVGAGAAAGPAPAAAATTQARPTDQVTGPNGKAVAVPRSSPPALSLLSPSAKLSTKEGRSAAIARDWRARPAASAEGAAGSVNYMFGASIPSVVCAPLYVCSISLQPGEVVNDIKAGDAVRWLITPSIVGSGADRVTVVSVKPTDAGLRTDLAIATTRRLYQVQLVSTQTQWMGNVTFTYPEDAQASWQKYQAQQQKEAADTTLPNGRNIAALDFNYAVSGDVSWKPLRVYSDGVKTYIQFPRAMLSGDAPSLVALGNDGGLFSSPTKQIVNYRVEGDTYVVDKVLDRAALLSGVGGSQEEIKIAHTGARR
ncbi:MAG: P-type conjugative transfer protein TrbG [Acetobacteraceae bacterium]|nr:P-type conjugative transfer protein TrbG [Acetobacteraceae bacterium]